MKKSVKMLICFLLLLFLPFSLIQAEDNTYVVDEAGLLSTAEADSLNEEARKLSDQYGFGVYIHTIQDDNAYDDIYTYTENYYTQNKLGYDGTSDGVLFLIAMSDQGGSYDVYTPGNVSEKMISTAGVGMAGDAARTYLQAHDYNKACNAYLDSIASQLAYYEENGIAETYDEENQKTSHTLRYVLIFGLPLTVALIAILVMLSMNKTKHKATTANAYIPKNGVHMNTVQDFFLYRTETREPLPHNDDSRSSSSFTSSSGGSHAGGHF